MSSFFDDLIASDETLANADASTDATVRELIAQAAKDGSIKTLRLAIERGQVNTTTDQAIVDAAVNVIGNDRTANRLTNKEMDRRISFVNEWVDAVAGPRPAKDPEALEKWNQRTGSMLGACFSAYMSGHDHVAGELIQMGVPSNGKFQKAEKGAMTEISGARLNTSEETASVTVMALAINNRSRWLKDLVAKDPEGLPVVATVKVGDKTQEVNAAGYALVLGDTKSLRAIIAGLSKHMISQREAIQEKLGTAIDHAEKLGLLDFGPDEVVHGVAMLLAAGAKVKNPAAFLARTITMVEIPGLANDPLATKEQAKEVADAVKARTYTLASAMLHAPNPADVIGALKAMTQMGWDTNQPVQPSSSLDGALAKKTTCAHLAALNSHEDVVSTLKFLGCDMKREDDKGNKPIDYARAGSLSRGVSFDLDFARIFDAGYMPRPGDKISSAKDARHEDTPVSSPNANAKAASTAEVTPSPTLKTNSTAKTAPNIDDVNAQAMMAANEDNDRGSYDYGMFDDDLVPASLASAQPKSSAHEPVPAALAEPVSVAPAAPSKPMSTFERMKAGQAARNAIANTTSSFSAKP